MTDSSTEPVHKVSSENWVRAGSSAAVRWLNERTAERQAAFLLPHLNPGMNLLDCGCGPGSITVGLARHIGPGQVVGIDLDASSVESARRYVAEYNLPNLRFETGDIHALPFADASFDAVFSNAVLTYSLDPSAALQEMYRVLRPGGVIGIRNVDYDGHLFAPAPPLLVRCWELMVGIQERRGHKPYLGKYQRGLLQQAGFRELQVSATYESYGTEETARKWGEMIAEALQEKNIVAQMLEIGAERSEIDAMHGAWQEWGEHPEAFFADAYCEAVARKPEGRGR